MNNNLRTEIRSRMTPKDTDELLEIWRTNNRFDWSDDAFDVIEQILKERGVEIPEQNKPISEPKEEENNGYDFSDGELRIIDDENPPIFYDPPDVLLATKRIDWIAKWMIAFTIGYNILNFQRSMGIVQPYFIKNPNSVLIYIFTLLLLSLNAVMGIVVIYFPLKALAHILRILMEMEFQSQKVN